MAALSA